MGENNRMPKPADEMPQVPNHDEAGAEVPVEVVPQKPKREIEVVATRLGYFAGVRRKAGDKFTIPSLDKSGEWMRCTDPKIEAEHQVLVKKRKQRVEKKAGK
jgi:hypothetical protein